jgi:hypothetical protein
MKMKPTERVIALSLQLNPGQTVENLCATTGVSNRYRMLASLRTMEAFGLVSKSDTVPTTYSYSAEVVHV